MSGNRDDVTINFDHHLSALAVNPDHLAAELRHGCPVAYSKQYGGFWILSQYQDVDKATRDSGSFTTVNGTSLPPPPFGDSALVNFDPPEHTKYRKALAERLSPAAVEAMKPQIKYWTDRFIDRIIEKGTGNFVYDISVGIPTAVTMEWLGWDIKDDWWKFGIAWHDLMAIPITDPRYGTVANMVMSFDDAISEHVISRRENPTNDTISHVANMIVDGERIPHEHAVSLIRVLVGAGVDTTTALISAAFVHLHFYPKDRKRLIDNPELWPNATEEFLRRYPPVRIVTRGCKKETQMEGQTIEQGDRIIALLSSANMDSKAFADPLRFDMDRSPNRHMTFGSGIHVCMGMHLARAEFQIVLRRLLERMPDYAINESGLIPYSRQSTVTGWAAAPFTFTPGRKLSPDDDATEGYSIYHAQ